MDKRNNSLLDRKFEIYRNNNENRELERGGLLGINCRDDDTITKLNNNVNSLYDKNSNNTGEITGLKINNFDLLQGMPMRQEMKIKFQTKSQYQLIWILIFIIEKYLIILIQIT